MFIGRTRELEALNRLYRSDKFEFVVIYGRRRVGKTALINQFIKEKKSIYFTGVESNAKQNLENFSRNIIEYETGLPSETSFTSFQSAIEHVFKLAEKERIILVIDEYPYVARASKSLASTLQFLIDQYKDSSGLMLILCGSSMSYMEDHVLAYKAPLYGRRTAQMKIVPYLLAVTRIEEGRLNLHLTDDLIDDAVEEALRHVNRKSVEHHITVEKKDEFLLARMDAKLIVQVLINIIDNAIKYTPEGSHIIIRTEKRGKQAVISIADDGEGIPDDMKPRVFDMFYSGANKIADSRRSLGLGLSLCRSIIHAHGGEITVSDNHPHGTIFTFTLPAGEVKLHE